MPHGLCYWAWRSRSAALAQLKTSLLLQRRGERLATINEELGGERSIAI